MVFELWKNEKWVGGFVYSLRTGRGLIPIILDHQQFEGLFPDIDVQEIPKAPKWISVDVNAVILP